MAYTFPLATSDFMDLLQIQQIRFDCPEQVEMSQTGGGELLRADLAPMLWTGEVRFGAMTQIEAADPDVLLDLLRPAGRTFYAYDTRRPAPLADPSGAILGASTPVIYSIGSARTLRLGGLPSGYVLKRGDYLAFDYGTSPVRRALHRVVPSTVIVPGTGITGSFEVSPPLRPGASGGTPVSLIKAACKAVIVPNAIDKGKTTRTTNQDMSFRFQQTLG